VKKIVLVSLMALSTFLVVFAVSRAAELSRRINLPTSKTLTLPVPGYLARTNSFPATIALSPDGHFVALLNQGYGTQESGARQSIAILDLSNNEIHDFPDSRLSDETTTHQSYFVGLAFSSDGSHLYASIGSITDPTGEKPKSTGNGIAVYKFAAGQVTPERFIKIAPQRLAAGKEVSFGVRKTAAGTALPYPAGLAVLGGSKGDRLLVANNISDNVVLLNINSGQVQQSFDWHSHSRLDATDREHRWLGPEQPCRVHRVLRYVSGQSDADLVDHEPGPDGLYDEQPPVRNLVFRGDLVFRNRSRELAQRRCAHDHLSTQATPRRLRPSDCASRGRCTP